MYRIPPLDATGFFFIGDNAVVAGITETDMMEAVPIFRYVHVI